MVSFKFYVSTFQGSIFFIVIAEGLDFFYSAEAHARKMVDFVTNVLPCKTQHSKRLISHDVHSNTYNYKYTWR